MVQSSKFINKSYRPKESATQVFWNSLKYFSQYLNQKETIPAWKHTWVFTNEEFSWIIKNEVSTSNLFFTINYAFLDCTFFSTKNGKKMCSLHYQTYSHKELPSSKVIRKKVVQFFSLKQDADSNSWQVKTNQFQRD